MKAIVQRVRRASVTVDGGVVGQVGPGFLILLGVTHEDSLADVQWMARKLTGLRVFPDEGGKMNHSLVDVGGEALVVSQFTIYGDCRKGRRPSFNGAAPPAVAEPLYERFCEELVALGVGRVERGVFGAHMDVALLNDGPVTLIVETPAR